MGMVKHIRLPNRRKAGYLWHNSVIWDEQAEPEWSNVSERKNQQNRYRERQYSYAAELGADSEDKIEKRRLSFPCPGRRHHAAKKTRN